MEHELNEKLMTPRYDGQTAPTLEFRDGQCLLTMVTHGGTLMERFVSMEAVREAATNIPVDSGWLTPEIVRWGSNGKGEWCMAFVPPGHHVLEATCGTPGDAEIVERLTVPLPGIVVFGLANKYFVWAQKGNKCEPQQELFRCPLPNVYQNGEICWGLLKPPQASPRTIMKAWQLFIGSTFNNHMANGKSQRHRDDVREMLRDLAAHEDAVYPVTDMVRQVQTGVTLDKAIRDFWQTWEMPQ